MSLLSYKYYDSPEGQDIYKKVFVTSKYATIAGLWAGSFDVLMYSHPKGFVKTVGRFAWYLGPMIGMATAFTVTANVAQNIRKKNDHINYFLGGAVSGTILSAWAKNVSIAVPAAVILGFCAMVKKSAVDEGWTFFPDVPQAGNTIQSVRRDWTIYKDPEQYKNFVTGSK